MIGLYFYFYIGLYFYFLLHWMYMYIKVFIYYRIYFPFIKFYVIIHEVIYLRTRTDVIFCIALSVYVNDTYTTDVYLNMSRHKSWCSP